MFDLILYLLTQVMYSQWARKYKFDYETHLHYIKLRLPTTLIEDNFLQLYLYLYVKVCILQYHVLSKVFQIEIGFSNWFSDARSLF